MPGQGAPAEEPWLVAGTLALSITTVLEVPEARKLAAAMGLIEGCSDVGGVDAAMRCYISGCHAVGDALVQPANCRARRHRAFG